MHVRARAGLGYLPQEPSVFRKLSVRDNLMAILETRADLNRQSRQRLLDELLHELHVGHDRQRGRRADDHHVESPRGDRGDDVQRAAPKSLWENL